jgi:L-asparaginase
MDYTMRLKLTMLLLLRCAVLLALVPSAQAANTKDTQAGKPHILLLATGGTIAGTAQSGSQVRYASGQLSPERLISAVPALAQIATIDVEQVAAVGSQDMSVAIWLDLVARTRRAFADRSIDGIVITHGTDTMEETAFFLDLVLPEDKPVVLVGAMRPADAVGADGPLNLLDAVKVAAAHETGRRGVLVVMNDTIHSARAAQKTHTKSVDTFRSRAPGPIGVVDSRGVRFYSAPSPQMPPLPLPAAPAFSRVEIIYAHADMDAGAVQDALHRGAKGLVLAGVGEGNASKAVLQELQRAASNGVVVVRSSRVGDGDVERNIEVDDDAMGFVAGRDLNPPKARLLLQLLLGSGVTDVSAIQRAFEPAR